MLHSDKVRKIFEALLSFSWVQLEHALRGRRRRIAIYSHV